MKKMLALLSILLCAQFVTYAASVSISNPIPLKFGNPFLLRASDGKYYMYGTSLGDGFEAFVSDDGLRSWKALGQVYKGAGQGQWNQDCFWAPDRKISKMEEDRVREINKKLVGSLK